MATPSQIHDPLESAKNHFSTVIRESRGESLEKIFRHADRFPFARPMPAIEGLRSPYDKTIGGLHHLGRMLDKIRLKQAGKLPEDFQRNYGLSIGLDGQLCGMLNVKFAEVEAKVAAGVIDAEIAEWIFSTGLRPNRSQLYIWNEHSRKLGWNDRLTAYFDGIRKEPGMTHITAQTAFDMIEATEGREPPPMK